VIESSFPTTIPSCASFRLLVTASSQIFVKSILLFRFERALSDRSPIAGTVEEDEHGEHTEVDFRAAACLGEEKASCYFKLINNIRDFRLYAWEKSAVTAAERKWSANGFMMEKELITATVLAKKKYIKPSPLTLCERED
jgi:hypothetical protein